MLEHGGRLLRAVRQYGIAREDWLDLSSGIAPWPYPIPHCARSLGTPAGDRRRAGGRCAALLRCAATAARGRLPGGHPGLAPAAPAGARWCTDAMLRRAPACLAASGASADRAGGKPGRGAARSARRAGAGQSEQPDRAACTTRTAAGLACAACRTRWLAAGGRSVHGQLTATQRGGLRRAPGPDRAAFVRQVLRPGRCAAGLCGG